MTDRPEDVLAEAKAILAQPWRTGNEPPHWKLAELLAALVERCEAETKRADEAVALLRECEWMQWCPCCRESRGHLSDCRLAAALKEKP